MYRKLKDKHKHTHSRYASKNRHKKISLKKNKILHGEKKENEIVVYEDKELSQGKLISFIQKQKQLHQEEIALKATLIQSVEESKEQMKESFLSKKEELKQIKKDIKEQKKQLKQEKKALKHAKKKNYGFWTTFFVILVCTVAALLFFSVQWVFHTWPNLKMDELMYQLTAPTEGTASDMYWAYFYQAGIPTIVCLIVFVILAITLSYTSKQFRNKGKVALSICSVICIGLSLAETNTRLDATKYFENKGEGSTFIESNYVDPKDVSLTFPEKKRNVIVLYLESMEMTYANKENGGGFNENFIPQLTQLSKENENFSGSDTLLNGAHSTSGTTWTMGGIFASTSGLPLMLSIDGNAMDTQNSFFKNATVLGDILDEEGYQQVFACGSDATFGGRKLYFTEHGNYAIHDLNYRKETGDLPEDYYVWWGFEDEKLIEYAKEDLTELASSNQPFNYTMLTADTHFEDGYVCDLCHDLHNGNQYGNVISCSDKQVSEFVSWIQQQDWYDNTTIVITGDHPTMDSDFCDPVSSDYSRRVYTAYINADPVDNYSEGKRQFTTLDTFPTTLAAMGVDIEGNHLGLGTNVFSGEETLLEKDGMQMINTEFSKKSDFLNALADVNPNAEGMRNRGSVVGLDFHVDEVNEDTLSVTCDDLYGINGTLNSLELFVQDSDGNQTSNIMNYVGEGTFKAQITVPNGNMDSVYIGVDAHSTDNDKNSVTERIFEYNGNIRMFPTNDLTSFLNELNALDRNRYIILMNTQGIGVSNFSENEKILLGKLGAGNVASSDGKAAFAVIDGNESYSKVSDDYLREGGTLSDGTPYVISSSSNSEQASSILLGDYYDDYSRQAEGINVVIWDKETQSVVCSTYYQQMSKAPSFDGISTKTSLLSNDVEVIADNPMHFDDVKHVVAVMYDNEKCSKVDEVTMTLNYDNTYIATFKDVKKEFSNKSIYVYAVYENGSRELVEKYTHDSE